MEEVNQNLPPKNQRSEVPTRASHQKLPKFSFPLRKKAIFFQTPRKYLKDQRCRRSDPLRNDVQGPPQKISSIGGVWILNGMAPRCTTWNPSTTHRRELATVAGQQNTYVSFQS